MKHWRRHCARLVLGVAKRLHRYSEILTGWAEALHDWDRWINDR